MDEINEIKLTRAEKKQARKEKKRQKTNYVGYSLENDIRYRGPLGILEMRILAWVCIALTQLYTMTKILPQDVVKLPSRAIKIVGFVGNLAVPMFLMATFAYIMQNRRFALNRLTFYFACAVGVEAVFLFALYRYGVGILHSSGLMTKKEAIDVIRVLLEKMRKGFFDFNIFVDLLLFTSLVYFLLEKPPKKFENREKLFRSFAFIPLFYEIVMTILRSLHIADIIVLPIVLNGLMPTKAPLSFIAFVWIVGKMYSREKKFYSDGGTHEQYRGFLKTNKNSLVFAKTCAGVLCKVALVDFVLLVVLLLVKELTNSTIVVGVIDAMKLGDTASLLIFSPIMFLFSYNKPIKNKTLLVLIPIVGIGLILFLFLEIGYDWIVWAAKNLLL